MSINVLAESAKTCRYLNEEKIITNFNRIIDSLDTISEEVIHSDASVVPVINLDENVFNDIRTKLRNKSIASLEKDIKSFDDGIAKDTAELKELKGKTDDKSEKRKEKLKKEIQLLKDGKKGIQFELNRKKESIKNESYAITLNSLIEVSEAYGISIDESVKTIRELNGIPDAEICCVLPENINEQVTVEEFCNLVDYLNESNIFAAWTSELPASEFITESGKISAFVDSIKNKFKSMNVNNINKNINDCKEKIKKLKEELDKVNKMSEEEGNKYAKVQSSKNVVIATGAITAFTAGSYAGSALVVFRPLLGSCLLAGTFVGYSKAINMISKKNMDLAGFSKKKYINCINNTIDTNKYTIRILKNRLKFLESKK